MDIASVTRRRLEALGLEQRDRASAAPVTESYISQWLTRKKAPPDLARTDIYAKMENGIGLRRNNKEVADSVGNRYST